VASSGKRTSSITVASGYVTAGDVTTTNVGATWTLHTNLDDFSIAAVVGDRVEFIASFLGDLVGTNFLDAVVVANGSIVRYGSTGTATPATEGDPTAYREASSEHIRGLGPVRVTCQSGDLHGGNITFGIAYRGTGTTSTIFAGTNYPLRWQITNYGQ
jgi:hypothetical protein